MPAGSTVYHIGVSVRGALKNWTKRELAQAFRSKDGSRLTADQAKDALLDHLSQGHEIIPCGQTCDHWDWKEGCLGHPETAAGGEVANG